MNIPGLGEVNKDHQFGEYVSAPVSLPLLNGKSCTVFLERYDDDDHPEEFEAVVANLLLCQFSVLEQAEQHVFDYCQDMNSLRMTDDEEYVRIDSPNQVWRHVQLGNEAVISRNAYGDSALYVSFACSCDWEQEHGLQIVLKDGMVVTKVGPYNGHLTNASALGDSTLDGVIYRRIGRA